MRNLGGGGVVGVMFHANVGVNTEIMEAASTQGPCFPSYVSQCQCDTADVTGCTGALSGCGVCA